MKRTLKQMTSEELFSIADIATGGYFTSNISSNQQKVEHASRNQRGVKWTQKEENGIIEHFSFYITAHSGCGWAWYCVQYVNDNNGSSIDHIITCLSPAKIVDFCDTHGLDVRQGN